MSEPGAALAAAAESLIGVPFKLHGRDPRRGLDCVGFVAAALAVSGRTVRAPAGYRLRHCEIDGYLPLADAAGFVAAEGPTQPGDILLTRPAPAQFHLMMAAMGGAFLHAHAGLGRVVASPAPLRWPVERHWRLPSD
jgi:cell wall-associated NlpC family hydrolase